MEERVLARLDRGENAGEGRGIWERGAEPEGTGVEKSQASWPPLGSPRRQLGVERMWKNRVGLDRGWRSWSRGIKRPGFSRIVAKLVPLLAAEWTTSRSPSAP